MSRLCRWVQWVLWVRLLRLCQHLLDRSSRPVPSRLWLQRPLTARSGLSVLWLPWPLSDLTDLLMGRSRRRPHLVLTLLRVLWLRLRQPDR